jgi:hypothetical protein
MPDLQSVQTVDRGTVNAFLNDLAYCKYEANSAYFKSSTEKKTLYLTTWRRKGKKRTDGSRKKKIRATLIMLPSHVHTVDRQTTAAAVA